MAPHDLGLMRNEMDKSKWRQDQTNEMDTTGRLGRRCQGTCVLEAKVPDVILRGAALRCELDDGTGVTYTALASADDPPLRGLLGEMVWIGWEPEQGYLVPRHETQ